MFCQARKNLSKNGVHLDLIKERFTLYKNVKYLVNLIKSVKYFHVDVNSQLKIKFENNKELFFHLKLYYLI